MEIISVMQNLQRCQIISIAGTLHFGRNSHVIAHDYYHEYKVQIKRITNCRIYLIKVETCNTVTNYVFFPSNVCYAPNLHSSVDGNICLPLCKVISRFSVCSRSTLPSKSTHQIMKAIAACNKTTW